jgi:hypothetical protein
VNALLVIHSFDGQAGFYDQSKGKFCRLKCPQTRKQSILLGVGTSGLMDGSTSAKR